MIGADSVSVLAAVVPLAIAVLGGGFAMAFRLGRLEQTVGDLKDDVVELMRRNGGVRR